MAYKVTTKSGKTYRASTINHLPGFLQMECWNGEHRIPAGEVTYIKSTDVDEIPQVILPIFIFAFVFFLIIILIFIA